MIFTLLGHLFFESDAPELYRMGLNRRLDSLVIRYCPGLADILFNDTSGEDYFFTYVDRAVGSRGWSLDPAHWGVPQMGQTRGICSIVGGNTLVIPLDRALALEAIETLEGIFRFISVQVSFNTGYEPTPPSPQLIWVNNLQSYIISPSLRRQLAQDFHGDRRIASRMLTIYKKFYLRLAGVEPKATEDTATISADGTISLRHVPKEGQRFILDTQEVPGGDTSSGYMLAGKDNHKHWHLILWIATLAALEQEARRP